MKINEKPRIETLSLIKDYQELSKVFLSNGYQISDYNLEYITFFDQSKCVNGTVPITHFFKMNKKDFSLVARLMKKIKEGK